MIVLNPQSLLLITEKIEALTVEAKQELKNSFLKRKNELEDEIDSLHSFKLKVENTRESYLRLRKDRKNVLKQLKAETSNNKMCDEYYKGMEYVLKKEMDMKSNASTYLLLESVIENIELRKVEVKCEKNFYDVILKLF
jgi:hypothetical protein